MISHSRACVCNSGRKGSSAPHASDAVRGDAGTAGHAPIRSCTYPEPGLTSFLLRGLPPMPSRASSPPSESAPSARLDPARVRAQAGGCVSVCAEGCCIAQALGCAEEANQYPRRLRGPCVHTHWTIRQHSHPRAIAHHLRSSRGKRKHFGAHARHLCTLREGCRWSAKADSKRRRDAWQRWAS